MQQKLSQEELSSRLVDARKAVTVGADYKHYKGFVYKILSLAILESTNEVVVVYQAQYGSQLIFVRPLNNWLEFVDVNGERVRRFNKVA